MRPRGRLKRASENIADIFPGKTNYFGCGLAFRRELVAIGHTPDYVGAHESLGAGSQSDPFQHLDPANAQARGHPTGTTSSCGLWLKPRACESSRLICPISGNASAQRGNRREGEQRKRKVCLQFVRAFSSKLKHRQDEPGRATRSLCPS